MSLILDALKKLDRERSSRRNKTADIAVEILRPDLPHQRKGILRYLAAASLAAVATAAITYVVITEFGLFGKSPVPAPVNSQALSRQAAPAPSPREPLRETREETTQVSPKIQDQAAGKSPVVPAPPPSLGPADTKPQSQQATLAPAPRKSLRKTPEKTVRVSPKIQDQAAGKSSTVSGLQPPPSPADTKPLSQPTTPAPAPREPLRETREETAQIPPKIQDQAEGKGSAVSAPQPPPSPAGTKPLSQPAAPAPALREPLQPKIPNASGTTPPSMRLSGILWSEQPSERRAVINGMFLTEGSVIEGVKVIEIGPTRVRLSHNGRPFEVSINNIFGE